MRLTTPRIVAAVASAALLLTMSVAPASAAAPTAGTFNVTGTTASKIRTPTILKAGTTPHREIKLSVNVSGTPSDVGYDDSNGDGATVGYSAYGGTTYPKIVALRTKEKRPSVPYLTSPTRMKSGSNTFRVHVGIYTTPGLYEARIPVTQTFYPAGKYTSTKTTRTVKVRFQVIANTKTSKTSTRAASSSWRKGKTATIRLSAPEYQQGARVAMYYKKKGAKNYAKLGTKKVTMQKKYGRYNSTAIFKTRKLTKSGTIIFKISSVKYAKGYKSRTVKVVVR